MRQARVTTEQAAREEAFMRNALAGQTTPEYLERLRQLHSQSLEEAKSELSQRVTEKLLADYDLLRYHYDDMAANDHYGKELMELEIAVARAKQRVTSMERQIAQLERAINGGKQ